MWIGGFQDNFYFVEQLVSYISPFEESMCSPGFHPLDSPSYTRSPFSPLFLSCWHTARYCGPAQNRPRVVEERAAENLTTSSPTSISTLERRTTLTGDCHLRHLDLHSVHGVAVVGTRHDQATEKLNFAAGGARLGALSLTPQVID